MSRKRLSSGERLWNDFVDRILAPCVGLLLLGLFGWIYLHPDKAKTYSYIVLGIAIFILIIVVVIYFVVKKHKIREINNYIDEDRLLNSFKIESPDDFEKDVADIFSKHGYKTKVVGGTHDGAIDVRATKDGELYLIQCKRWTTNRAGVQDVRQLHSAVHREMAKRGIFVSISGFTIEAEEELGSDPRIELIDGQKLVELYKSAENNIKK